VDFKRTVKVPLERKDSFDCTYYLPSTTYRIVFVSFCPYAFDYIYCYVFLCPSQCSGVSRALPGFI